MRKDSIYLFTKQWLNSQTTVYAFPKKPGTHVAKRIESFDTKGLVTGATYLEAQRMVVLCGYNTMMHPFLYLFYNYRQDKFFSGNKRRVELSMPFHQVEGITTCDGFTYHITSEAFLHEPYVNNPQEMHVFDLKYIFIESAGVEK